MNAYVESTEGYEGGFYKDDDTLYTYEELVALYESGATLMAYPRYYTGATVTVEVNHYEEGYEFSANVPTFSLDVTFGVFIDHAGYDNRVYPIGIKPLAVHFRVNGSPSSLTGTDIFIPSSTHAQIMDCINQGVRVFGLHTSDSHQSGVRVLQFEGSDDTSYQQIYFRDCRPVHDGASGGHMEDLLIVVRDVNGETHTESYFNQYELPVYTP